jgi:hypothetical protein
MKNKKFIIALGSMILVAVLIIVGVVVLGKKDVEKPSLLTPTPSSSATPTIQPLPSDFPKDSTSGPTEPTEVTEDDELSAAQEAFPDVHATNKHTKEQVQLAMYAAMTYSGKAVNDRYLLSGDFVKDGFPQEYYDNIYRSSFTAIGYSFISQAISDIQSGDETRKFDGLSTLQQLTNFETIGDSGYKQTEDCIKNGNCLYNPTGGNPITYSDFTYDAVEADDRIMVKFETTSQPLYVNTDGVEQHLNNTYTWTLYMAPNDSPVDFNAGNTSWVIDGFQVNVSKKGFSEN